MWHIYAAVVFFQSAYGAHAVAQGNIYGCGIGLSYDGVQRIEMQLAEPILLARISSLDVSIIYFISTD